MKPAYSRQLVLTGSPLQIAQSIIATRVTLLDHVRLAVVALSVLCLVFLIVDPLVLQVVRTYDESTRDFFRSLTDSGKAVWVLVPAAMLVCGLYLYHRGEIRLRHNRFSGLSLQIMIWFFLTVTGTSLAACLIKNIIGRARPKLYDTAGPLAFEPFTFSYDYAAFPSGHATTICVLAATLAILWPRARIFLFAAACWIAATRFLVGSHFFSDAVCGALLGFSLPYLVRDHLARRRMIFEMHDGECRVRCPRLRTWGKALILRSMAPRCESCRPVRDSVADDIVDGDGRES